MKAIVKPTHSMKTSIGISSLNLLLFSGLFALSLLSRQPLKAQCNQSNQAYGDGEEVTFVAAYNWGPVWVDAGLVTFSVREEDYFGKPSYHLKAVGKTFKSYDILFKVRDYYDSWINRETLEPIGFKRYIYEGGYTLLNTLYFDKYRKAVISNTKTNDNPQRADTLPARPCGFDMLSAIYHTRALDLASMKPDERHFVTVAIDDAWYDIYIKMIGKDVVEGLDGKQYRCIKFSVKMVQGTIFKGDEDVLVWVTDDANKAPVYIEAKIIVGTVKVYLKAMKGLRNPVTSVSR